VVDHVEAFAVEPFVAGFFGVRPFVVKTFVVVGPFMEVDPSKVVDPFKVVVSSMATPFEVDPF
jgi:hypothetical protein